MLTTKTKQSLSQGTVSLMTAEVIFLFSNYLINIGVARFLGPEMYGVFGVLTSLYLINRSFLNLGLPKAVSKFISESNDAVARVFKSSMYLQLFLSLFFGLAYFLLAPWLASWLGDVSLTNFIRFLGIIVIPSGMLALYSSGYMNGLKKFREQTIIKIVFPALRVILIFFFVFLGLQIFGTLLGTFVAVIISLLLSFWLLKPPSSSPSLEQNYKNTFSRMVVFAIPLTIAAVALASIRNINILFIKSYLGDNTLVGLYTAAQTLSNIPFLVFLALPIALLPSISKSTSQGNLPLTQKYIKSSLRYLLLLLVPVIALLSATAAEALTLFYPSFYGSAAPVFTILVIGALFLAFFATLGSIISGSGKPHVEMCIALVLVGSMILLNFYFIPHFGIIGAALSSLITSVLASIAGSIYVYHKFRVLLDVKSTIKIITAGLVIFSVGWYWHYSWIYLFFTYILMTFLYLLILYLGGELTQADWDLVKKVFKKRKEVQFNYS